MTLAAPLLYRKRVILVKLESTKGSEITADQPLVVFDLDMNPVPEFDERRGIGLYRGMGNKGVVYGRTGTCTFKTEMKSNGVSGLDTGLAILLQACGFKKTSEAYAMHSEPDDDKTITIDVYEDGVLKTLYGCSGNVIFDFNAGKVLICNFTFSGIWKAPADLAMDTTAPSSTLPMIGKSGTFTLATNAIKISKFSLDMGCRVVPRGDITGAAGLAYFMITDYDGPMLSIDPEADTIAGYDYHALWLAGTEAAVSLVVNDGVAKATFTIPKFQFRDLKMVDREGLQIYDLTGQCNHSAGNDAVAIAAAAV